MKGYGDPALRVADLRALVRRLRAQGVTRITGRVVADRSYFSDPLYPRGSATPDGLRGWAPQISALTLSPNSDLSVGTIEVTVRSASRRGHPATISVAPASAKRYVDLSAWVVTGRSTSIDSRRGKGTNDLRVTGRIALGAKPVRVQVSVHRPDLLAATVLRDELRSAGIAVGGVASGRAPTKRALVLTHRSRPLIELMAPLLKLSNTGLAEHLVRLLGAHDGKDATVANGVRQVRRFVQGLGVSTKKLRLADGSGLTPTNKITAGSVAAGLAWATRRPWFARFLTALPQAGHRGRVTGGTLSTRMRHTAAAGRVWAKTGTRPRVTALSGYVLSCNGHLYVFSMLSTYRWSSPRPVEDRLAATIARFGRC